MKTYTLDEIVEIIENETNLECFIFERNKTQNDHFVLDLINDVNFFASNSLQKSTYQIQLTFFTKNARNKNNFHNIITLLFNSTATFTYEDDNEWYLTIYDFNIFMKDE